ncbi:MAG: hypothetical protein OEQ53_03720 [Saprospiraceae bacterium]|nr:hypothetical protein [Saprospiraceae bacterium]
MKWPSSSVYLKNIRRKFMYQVQILVSLLLLLTLGCSSLEVKEYISEDGILEQYQVERESGQRHGWYKRYQQNTLREECNYQYDQLDGQRVLYDGTGSKVVVEHYVNGIYEGAYQSYYPTGELKLEGLYVRGSMEGEWNKYYFSGQLMEIVEMHDNEENGAFVEYYENGSIKAEGSYLEGDNEHGELKLYDESGELERTMQCDRGICHTTWKRESDNTTEDL